MHRRNDRTGPLRRRRQGCAPARPALHVSTLLFAASAKAHLAIGAEALSHQLDEVFAFLGRAMSDRAGARPYQLKVRGGRDGSKASLRGAYNVIRNFNSM